MATHGSSESSVPNGPRLTPQLCNDSNRDARFKNRKEASEVPSVIVMEPAHIRNQYHRIPSDDIDPISPALSGTTRTLDSSYTEGRVQEDQDTEGRSKFVRARRLLANLGTLPFSAKAPKTQEELDKEELYNKVEIQKLENFVAGRPRLAAIIDSADGICMHRRFGPAAERILIRKQIEIHLKLKELQKQDELDDADYTKKYRLQSIEHYEEWDQAQRNLENEFEAMYTSYIDLYLKYTQMRTHPEVSNKCFGYLQNYIVPNEVLVPEEESYLLVKEDLVTTMRQGYTDTQESKFNDVIDWVVANYPRSCFAAPFKDKETTKKTDNPHIIYPNNARRLIVGKLVFAYIAAMMMLVPSFLIYLIDLSPKTRALIVAGFFVLSVMLMSALVDLNERDIFLCIAAYSAILLAMLGNTITQCGAV